MCNLCQFSTWGDPEGEVRILFRLPHTWSFPDCSLDRYTSIWDLEKTYPERCLGCICLLSAAQYILKDNPWATIMCVEKSRHSLGVGIRWVQWGNGIDYGLESKRTAIDWELRKVCGRQFDIFTLPGTNKITGIPVRRHLDSNTYPIYSGIHIRQWISTCLKEHRQCTLSKDYVPPRLLDLNHTTNERLVRLVVTKTNGQLDRSAMPDSSFGVKYACLSHCWGKSKIACLTKKHNVDLYQSRISVEDLPLTFQDAIEMCRNLEIRYLWIDSLCIVQDDQIDWEAHVNEMTEIFSYSYLTMGAATSLDSTGGLFRQALLTGNGEKPMMVEHEGNDYAVFMRASQMHWFEQGQFLDYSLDWPLMKRGWVFQEYLLSPRFVAFAEKEVAWTCREDWHCCCDHKGQICYEQNEWLDNGEPLTLGTKKKVGQLASLSQNQARDLWRNIVTLYSTLKLTFVEDRIPAIAGVAKLFKPFLGDEYLGGLWRKDLASGILWQLDSRADLSSENPQQDPSWLWTTATGGLRIIWLDNIADDNLHFEILNIETLRRTANELSDITWGYLTIRGSLLPMSLEREETNSPWFDGLRLRELWQQGSPLRSRYQPEMPADYLAFDYSLHHSLNTTTDKLHNAQLLLASCKTFATDDPDIQKAYGKSATFPDIKVLRISGILVVPFEDEVDGSINDRCKFKRVGMLKYSWRFHPATIFPSNSSSGIYPEMDHIKIWGGLEVPKTTFDLV